MADITRNSLELFGGAGGLALGIAELGYASQGLIEFDRSTCVTLRLNQQARTRHVHKWPVVQADVRDVDYSNYPDIDLLAGGPPCQPFSLGGKHRAYNDTRDMFPEAVRAVRDLQPRAFIFENVKGLTRQTFASYFSYIQLQLTYPSIVRRRDEEWEDHLARLEMAYTGAEPPQYRVVVRLLNAADYGVPQKRERVIFVGFRADLGLEWSFPKPTHSRSRLLFDQYVTGEYWDRHEVALKDRPNITFINNTWKQKLKEKSDAEASLRPWLTVRDALHDLPEPSSIGHPKLSNHVMRLGARSYPGHTGSMIDEPSKTIKAGSHGVPGGENMLARNDGTVRYFTVRESARIQTFPDDYVFPVSWTESMRQLGNAVPVKLGLAVAKSVHDLLDSKSELIQPSREKKPSGKRRQRAAAPARNPA